MQNVMLRNKPLVGLIFVVVAIIIWSIFQNKTHTTTDAHSNTTSTLATDVANTDVNNSDRTVTPVTSTVEKNNSLNTQVADNEPRTVMGTRAEAAQVKQWMVDRGYLYADKRNNDYKSYDDDTLRKLAKEGDVKAMLTLGDLYTTDPKRAVEYGIDAAVPLYMEAATRGSTYAFEALARTLKADLYLIPQSEEAKKAGALELLAICNTASLRGDQRPNDVTCGAFKSNNNIQLSAEDQQIINQRSQKMYDELQAKRTALGLGDFDNSVPETVKNYFNQTKSR